MHLRIIATIVAIVSLAAASCTPPLPPVDETVNYVSRTGEIFYVLPIRDECYVFTFNGTRPDFNRNYNYEAIGLYQSSIVEWMNIIRGKLANPDYWQFACGGRRWDGSDRMLISIHKTPGLPQGPATCAWKTKSRSEYE